MALSRAENLGVFNAGNRNTVDVDVGDKWMSAASFRGIVQHAKDKVAEVYVIAAANMDETEERSVRVRMLDRLTYSIQSVNYNLEHTIDAFSTSGL